MRDWITDRRPTEQDCDGVDRIPHYDHVWVMHEGRVTTCPFGDVVLGCPWQPMVIQTPWPYVKPKRYTVDALRDTISGTTWYEVWDNLQETSVAVQITSRERAERIAAIYEEVMP